MIAKTEGNAGKQASRRRDEPDSRSLEDLMQLTFEIWVVGMLLYYLGLTAVGLN